MDVVITRVKQYQRRGRYQWRWLYKINYGAGVGLDHAEAPTLHQARTAAAFIAIRHNAKIREAF